MDFFGNQFHYSHVDTDKALFYFRYNTENYPKSSNAWYSLGKIYEEIGEKGKAIISCKKSLDLVPTNKEPRKKLKGLTNK